MRFSQISGILALTLASSALALPSPNPNPVPDASPNSASGIEHLYKRCDVCTKSKGTVCQSGCHVISPTQIIQACGALGINIGASGGISGIIHSALNTKAGVDVDVDASAGAHADFADNWSAICGQIGIPTTGVSIQGSLDVGASLNAGAGVGAWLGGLIGGGGCGVCGD